MIGPRGAIVRLSASAALLIGATALLLARFGDFFLPWFFLSIAIGFLIGRWWALLLSVLPNVLGVAIARGPFFPIAEAQSQGLLTMLLLWIVAILMHVGLPGLGG